MIQKQEDNNSALSPTTVKALTILCTLSLCALIYVFVQLRANNNAPPAVEVYTPRPASEQTPEATPEPTPEATPEPGARKSAVIERLYDSGLFVLAVGKDDYYMISVSEEDIPCMLKLSVKDDYVQGFTLEIEGPLPPSISGNPGAIESEIIKEYATYLIYEEMTLRYMLPRLLDAVTLEGVFSPNTSLVWTELAISAREDGKTYQDSANGLSYTCVCTRLGVLTLAVGLE